MEINHRNDGDVTVLALKGQFETFSLSGFSGTVEGLIESGVRQVCLNLRDLSFINSTALGYLVDVGKRLKGLGGEMVFSEPSSFFAATARTLELHHLFEIFPTDSEATQHFGAAG